MPSGSAEAAAFGAPPDDFVQFGQALNTNVSGGVKSFKIFAMASAGESLRLSRLEQQGTRPAFVSVYISTAWTVTRTQRTQHPYFRQHSAAGPESASPAASVNMLLARLLTSPGFTPCRKALPPARTSSRVKLVRAPCTNSNCICSNPGPA